MTEEFRYFPLPDAGHIRLLRITSFNEQNSLIQCELISCLLESSLPFTALSYTWALPTVSNIDDEDQPDFGEEYVIWCEHTTSGNEILGGSLNITENLFDSLVQLTVPIQDHLLLWVDAICINQKDLEERASQVSLMGRIYSTAQEVLVWLGKDMSCIDDFIWMHEKFLPEVRGKEMSPGDIDNLAVLSPLGINSLDHWTKLWVACYQFYKSNRWFHRAWVVQEVSLARKIVVKCGCRILPWLEMMELSTFIHKSGWGYHFLPLTGTNSAPKKGTALGGEINRFENARYLYLRGPEAHGDRRLFWGVWGATNQRERWFAFLGHILYIHRATDATDARDKIYSALGLVLPFLPARMENPIIPTYYGTVPELYTQVTILLLQQLPFLTILSLVEDKSCRTIGGLPSWVPDYNFRFSSRVLVDLESNEYTRLLINLYNATSSKTIPEIYPRIDGNVLSVLGACFDTVAGQCVSIEGALRLISLRPIFELCLNLDDIYLPTNQVREEVLWRTWIADVWKTCPASPDLAKGFHDYICHGIGAEIARSELKEDTSLAQPTLEALGRLRGSSGSQHILPNMEEVREAAFEIKTEAEIKLFPEIHPGKVTNDYRRRAIGDMRTFDHAQGDKALNRTLYCTSRGLLGLGPLSMQANDEIWILQNGQVPFILRKEGQGGNYSFIGEAYLHGFMRGEMLTPEFKAQFSFVNIV